MPLHISSTCAHHQEFKISLHSLWYHHTYRWPFRAQVVKQKFCASSWLITEKIWECKQIVEYQKRKSCVTALLITHPLYSLSALNQLIELSFRNDVIKFRACKWIIGRWGPVELSRWVGTE